MFNLPTKKEDLQELINKAPSGWTGLFISDDGEVTYYMNANNVVLLQYATFLDYGLWIDVSKDHPSVLIDQEYLDLKINAS
jgi:hypothetical protein